MALKSNSCKAKITAQRVATEGALANAYTLTKLTGAADITLEGRVRDAKEKTFRVGDQLTHDELEHMCSISIYEVTVLAPSKN